MGKIIQIAIAGHANTSQTQSDWTLIALCDDGRLWGMDNCCRWQEIPLPRVSIQEDLVGKNGDFDVSPIEMI